MSPLLPLFAVLSLDDFNLYLPYKSDAFDTHEFFDPNIMGK